VWADIKERAEVLSRYIADTGCTVRTCAKKFSVSKSTVHKDVSERIRDYDATLYEKVRRVLDKNLQERHIRGGIATKNKYLKKDKVKNTP